MSTEELKNKIEDSQFITDDTRDRLLKKLSLMSHDEQVALNELINVYQVELTLQIALGLKSVEDEAFEEAKVIHRKAYQSARENFDSEKIEQLRHELQETAEGD